MSEACPEFRMLPRRIGRRELLQLGGLGAFGLTLPDLLSLRRIANADESRLAHGEFADAPGFGKAKACILVFLWGGPSQLETWDLKPKAPAEVRGEFRPIQTSVPTIEISEHFPHLAKLADKYAIIRSVTHDDPAHLSSVHHVMTGRHAPQVKSDAVPPSRKDTPHVGSVLSKLRPSTGAIPPFVMLPWSVMHPAAPGGTAPGQHAGWLGAAHDPFLVGGDPNSADFRVSGLDLVPEVSSARIGARHALLGQLNPVAGNLAGATGAFGNMQERAFDMLTAASVRRAFDLKSEPDAVRDRYGRHIHGQGLLLARRLIEAGVSLVCVNWHQDGQNFWDTHGNNFNRLKNDLMPPNDRGFSALIEDLGERGLLDETLVVVAGEFGRTPKINATNGRDHWAPCYTQLLAGGGVRGGQVYGASDRQGAYVKDFPVTPDDFAATILHAFGLSPETAIEDPNGRPVRISTGTPVTALF